MPVYTPKKSPYARTPFASMTNEGAADYHSRTGIMPKTTYGGKFGLGIAEPGAAPPAPATPRLGLAPTTPGQFQMQMHDQNPNGRFFGGTLPAVGTTPSGGARPQFFSGPVADHLGSTGQLPSSRFIGGIRPGEQGHQGLAQMSPGMPGYDAMQSAKTRFFSAHPNDVPQEQRYHSLGLATPAERRANRYAKAAVKGESRRLNMGIADAETRLEFADPAAFQGRMAADSASRARELGLSSDRQMKREAIAAQERMGAANNTAAEKRAQLAATASVLAHGGDPTALGLSGGAQVAGNGTLPKAQQEFRQKAIEAPEAAIVQRRAEGATEEQARQEVGQVNPQYAQQQRFQQQYGQGLNAINPYGAMIGGWIGDQYARFFGNREAERQAKLREKQGLPPMRGR